MSASLNERLEQMLAPAVTGLGYELVGIEYLGQGKYSVLRVYIDQPEGSERSGISVDDCSKVSYQVSGVLDVEDPLPGRYNLEVSSPGLDRPLFKPEDYERFKGESLRVVTDYPVAGQRKYKGRLLGLRDDEVLLDVEGETVALPRVAIKQARIIPQF